MHFEVQYAAVHLAAKGVSNEKDSVILIAPVSLNQNAGDSALSGVTIYCSLGHLLQAHTVTFSP